MRKLIIFSAFIVLAGLSQCKKESPDSISCDTTGLVADSIRYLNTVAPIMDEYCTGCHGNTVQKGQVNLSTYEGVKKQASNNKLLGTMGHLKGYRKMPREGEKIPQDKICKVKFWIDNGALNN